jgi:integrase
LAKNPVFKKCGCRIPVTGPDGAPVLGADGKPKLKRIGSTCPQLRRGSGWNPKHGTWHFQFEVNAGPEAGRQVIAQGGLSSSAKAQDAYDAIRRLLELADEFGGKPENANKLRLELIARIREALKDNLPLPDYEELKKAARAGQPVVNRQTVAEFLNGWLTGKGNLVDNTTRGYATHVAKYLIPHLGEIELDQLRVTDLESMFAAIAEDADIIPAENAARRAVENAAKQAWKDSDAPGVRAARAKLATMPPYRRPAGAATRQRIRATLRSALSDACARQLISINVAKLVHLESGKRPKARVWTAERVKRWRATGEKPSAVMVWTAEQTATFLARAASHEYFALYHLIAFTGLRRGEACGLRWIDLDLTAKSMTIAQQIVQIGWATDITAPKSEAGGRDVALDEASISTLKSHRRAQRKAKLAYGEGWIDTGLAFTAPDGAPLHPAWVSEQFNRLVADAGLPPIRLHDLRHGAASLALANGVDIKVVQEMLGHSSSTITRDTYTSVFSELKHSAAGAIAGAINAAATSSA